MKICLIPNAREIVVLFGALLVIAGFVQCDLDYDNIWQNQGGDITNRRAAPFEKKISTESVTSLSLKWTAYADLDISTNPSIDGNGRRGAVYFGSWDGCVYAVTKDKGKLIWKVNLTEIAPSIPGLLDDIQVMQQNKNATPALSRAANLVARATPTIAGPLLVFGIYGPCYVLGVKRTTGALVWWTSVDSHPLCAFTQSGTYFEGAVYIGTSSDEEHTPDALCCYFQGAFFKLDAKTGKIIWRLGMLPDNHGKMGLYSGAAIWGSSPAIDVSRRLVYIATGNDYTTPPNVTNCELAQQNLTHRPSPDPCIEPDDHSESFVAIKIDTGEIAWATHLGAYDTWTFVCQVSPVKSPNCPPILGPDADFGEAPLFVTVQQANGSSCTWRDIAVAGQKSGIIHALDRETGEVLWNTDAGPGSAVGGASWGMSTDGERVFTSIINGFNLNFTLIPSSRVITWGGWVAMNATTGAVLWSTANPAPFGTQPPVAYANGVVFGQSEGNFSSVAPAGLIVALDAVTGAVLWNYTTQGGLAGGVSIMDGCIYQPIGETPPDFGPANVIHGHSTIALCVP